MTQRVGDERLNDIINHVVKHGKEHALESFGITEETYNRYKREIRKRFGETFELLMKLKENYSDVELKAISKGGRIVPGYAKAPIIHFDGEEITFGIMSDTHLGSSSTDPARVVSALEQMEKMGCEFICHAGDVVEGMMGRKGHEFELTHLGYKAQRDHAVDVFSFWKKPLYMVGGNHDCSMNTKLGVGIDIVEDICSRLPSALYLGPNDGDLSIKGTVIKLFHGLDGAAYALGYRIQKIVESFTGGEKPNLLITGHDHKALYLFYRNVHAIAGGCIQKQTIFMRGKKLAAMCGFWIVTMSVKDGCIKWIKPCWYPFYV